MNEHLFSLGFMLGSLFSCGMGAKEALLTAN